MVGMLFFFIILLMAFALNYRSAEEQAAETEAKLTHERDAVSLEKDRLAGERDALASQRDQLALERDRIAAERDEISAVSDHLMRDNRLRTDMLATVLSLLREREVEVTLDPENGILRLPESLLFDSGEAVLRPQGVRALRELAAVLARTLPCYSRAPAIQQIDCPIVPKPLLEAVLVEGHTDDRPISTSTFADNWQLASARAINTFKALLTYEPSLEALLNDRGEALLGVSNYEAQRPVSLGLTPDARRLNRRIDLRFLIAAPSEAQLEAIRTRMHAQPDAPGAGSEPAPRRAASTASSSPRREPAVVDAASLRGGTKKGPPDRTALPLGPISSANAGHAVESPCASTNVARNSSVSEMFVKLIIA